MPMRPPSNADHLYEMFITTRELAQRWRTEPSTLQNQRASTRGLPFVRTPTGRVLYRMSDVIEAEISGMRGISIDRIENALRKCPHLDARTNRLVAGFLRAEFRKR